ncbi:MAG: hypothetical protein ACI9KE_001169 [Polyangiales bacterium]|jgi:hypothetical protein
MPGPFFGFVFLLLVGAGLFYVFGTADKRLKRRILKLPIGESIAQTPQNQDVRVSGTLAYVEGKAPLTAPISNRPCAAWRVIVEERRKHSNQSGWRKVIDDSASTDFALEDESGRAIVDGTALSLALNFDASGGQGFLNPASPGLKAFMEARGVGTHGMILKKTLRAREGILELGETVTVAGNGTFMNDPSGQSGYRGHAKLLHVKALSTGKLLASDDAKLRRRPKKKSPS